MKVTLSERGSHRGRERVNISSETLLIKDMSMWQTQSLRAFTQRAGQTHVTAI